MSALAFPGLVAYGHPTAAVTVVTGPATSAGEPVAPTTIASARTLEVQDRTAELRSEPGGDTVALALSLFDHVSPFPAYVPGQVVTLTWRGQSESLAIESVEGPGVLVAVEIVAVSRLRPVGSVARGL